MISFSHSKLLASFAGFLLTAFILTSSFPASAGAENCDLKDAIRKAMEGAIPVGGSERTFWGTWTCKNCMTEVSARPVAGQDISVCPNCGQPKPDNVEYHLNVDRDPNTGRIVGADDKLVKGEHEEEIAKKGKNIYCPYCHSANLADASTCVHCGGSLQDHLSETEKVTVAKIEQEPNGHKTLVIAASGATAVGLGGFIYWGTRTQTVNGSANNFEWKKEIVKQTFTQTSRDDWQRNLYARAPVMPVNGAGESPGVFDIRGCHSELERTEQVACGTRRQCSTIPGSCSTKSNGNGSFSESCSPSRESCSDVTEYCPHPIYSTKCTYSTYVWQETDHTQTSGNTTEGKMDWPQMKQGNLDRLLRNQTYNVQIDFHHRGKDKKYNYQAASEEDFRTWKTGDQVSLKVQNFGNVNTLNRK